MDAMLPQVSVLAANNHFYILYIYQQLILVNKYFAWLDKS